METSVILFFSGIGIFLALLLGGVIGWQYHEAVAKHTYKRQLDNLHPEFLDGGGSYVNEELLAVRFADPDDLLDDDDDL
jgi:hypothetical protein|tara:strand:- start:178 stop:414 length:237 start_codon:yes stop_codon:yes gene_type:complete